VTKQQAVSNPTGELCLVGTPIGNLEDITLRALRVLREVDLIAAEDTRVTRVLLQRHEVKTSLISYHEHSGPGRLEQLLDLLRDGKRIALVSDAGMPGISDPGARLVKACAEAGISITIAPGPTAVSTALALSGMAAKEFVFLGFLPSRSKARQQVLRRVADQRGTIVVYEAPHRLIETLRDTMTALGDRQAVCCRELTKKFEEVIRGALSYFVEHFRRRAPRGEFTIVISGAPGAAERPRIRMDEAAAQTLELIADGMLPSKAVAHVARWRGVSRRALYQAVIGGESRDEA